MEFIEIKKAYVVFAISRSGHHPIIDWIYESCFPNKLFLNDPPLNQTLDKRRMFYFNNQKYFNFRNYTSYYASLPEGKQNFDKRINNLNVHGWIPEKNKISFPKNLGTFITNLENFNLQTEIASISTFLSNISKNIVEKIAIIVVRNPYNLLASRIMHGKPITRKEKSLGYIDLSEFLDLWKIYATFCSNGMEIDGFDKTIIIKYDEWFNSKINKKRISEVLDLNTAKLIHNEVSIYGGGSSFDGYFYQGKANRQKTLDRWRQLVEDDRLDKEKRTSYIKFLRDHPEIEEYSEKIFGKIKGLDNILKK